MNINRFTQYTKATAVFTLVILLSISNANAKSKKTLIGVTLEYPPFNYENTQTHKAEGATPTLLRHIFDDLGYDLDIRVLPWKRSQYMVEAGSAHIIFTYTRSTRRQKFALYSNPVSTIRTIFVKNRNSKVPSTWNSLADLKPYLIGINGGYNYPPTFMRALEANIFDHVVPVISQNPTETNLFRLLNKRIDYFICSVDCIFEINRLPKQDKLQIEKIDHTIDGERTMHVGFSKNNNAVWSSAVRVREEFNALFDQYLKNGKVEKIYKQYQMEVDYKRLGSKLNNNWDNTLDKIE